jgi:gas vesicle protein
MLNFLFGLVVGVIGTAVAAFFIAKNNSGKLLKAFADLDGLPQKAKDLLASKGIKI